MGQNFEIRKAGGVKLVASRANVELEDVPQKMSELFDNVYNWLGSISRSVKGKNYAIYAHLDDVHEIHAGVPFNGDIYDSTGRVGAFHLVRTFVVHTRFLGDYTGLTDVHSQMTNWIDEKGLIDVGLRWEVYGDWSDDPQKRVTDVYCAIEQRDRKRVITQLLNQDAF